MSKKIYHISHVDADGYGCNVIMDMMSKHNATIHGFPSNNVESVSANYSYLNDIIELVVEQIEKAPETEEKLLMITDLNIKSKEFIDSILPRLEKANAKIQVIDHHKTTVEVAEGYDWYNADLGDCATKQFLNKFIEENPNLPKQSLDKAIDYANTIDQYDLYKSPLSDLWVQGSTLQDVAFKIKNAFNYQETLDAYLKQKNSTDGFSDTDKKEELSSALIDALKLNVKVSSEFSEALFSEMRKGTPIVDIEFKILPELYTQFLDDADLAEVKFLSAEEKVILNVDMPNRREDKIASRYDFSSKKHGFDDNEYFLEIMEKYGFELTIEDGEDCYKGELRGETYYYPFDSSDKNVICQILNISLGTLENELNYLIEEKKLSEYDVEQKLFKDREKDFDNRLKFLFPKGLEKERELISTKFKDDYLDKINSFSIDEIEYKFQLALREEIKKIVRADRTLSKEESVHKILSNEYMPNFMLIALTLGYKAVSRSIVKEFKDDEVGTKIKLLTNTPSSFFQHASHAYNSITSDSVLLNLNTNYGSMSARSHNGKAASVVKKYNDGGGHNNAGGTAWDLKVILPEILPSDLLEANRILSDRKLAKEHSEFEIKDKDSGEIKTYTKSDVKDAIEGYLVNYIEDTMSVNIESQKKSKGKKLKI